MKTWEKILLYLIGLCLWLTDHAKKAGKFIERKSKPAIAMLVAVTMMLSLMPLTAWALNYHSHPICGAIHTDIGDHTGACGDVIWTAVSNQSELKTMEDGKSYYLANDITVDSTIEIDGTVNLCLYGHTISAAGGNFDVSGTLNLCSCEDDGIIKRTSTTEALISADAGATANLYNVTLDGGAVWSGNVDSVLLRGTTNAGTKTDSPLINAGYQRTAGGHITLNSGVVLQNNECSDAGDDGAVTIGEDGTLVINGATICNNAKTDGNAGAIKAYAGAQITLNSGEIYGNAAYKHGGAFQIFGGDSTDYAHVVFSMNGGTIRNNKAAGVGGGIAVSDYSRFTMNGGSIIDNATTDSQNRGGGVGFADANTAMSISGNAVISGNAENNLYIGTYSCNKLTVGTLGSNANVGVTMKSSSGGVFTIGGAAYADKFTSDNPACVVAVDGNNLKLVKQFTVSFDKNGGTGSKDSVKVSDGDGYTLPSNPFTAPSGYQFKGWATSTTGDVITTDQIAVSADTTLYAIWEKLPAEAPSVQVSDNLTLTYGEFTNQKITATVDKKEGYTYSYQWVNDDNRVIGETDTLNIADDTAAGIYNYACNVFAKRNDNGEYKAITIRDIWVKVNAKAIDNNSANVTLSKTTFSYNGQEQKPAVTVTYNGNHLTENTDYTINWPADCKNVGSKTITVNFTGNYSGSAQKTFEIEKAPLTIAAKDKTITYGEPVANNGITYSGFVSNETTDVLGGTLAYNYTYNQYGDVGAYDITVSGLTSNNYEITFVKGTLTVQQKEIGIAWSNTALTYSGTAQKPTATATGMVNGDELALAVSGEQTDASDTAYTATVTGISGEKAGNYKMSSNMTTGFTIAKADQIAPTGLEKTDETISKKADGTITGITANMEYRKDGETTYTGVNSSVLGNLAAGKYFVRYATDSNRNASPDTAVTIAAGRKLTVTLPENQIGYTLTTTTPEIDYYGSIHVEFKLSDGYSMAENFEIYNGTEPIWQHFNQQTGVLEFTFVASDFDLSVTGVADNTAPAAQINITDNNWSSFWNGLTFGLLFNETQDVTISATDLGSGVNTIQYYLASGELERDEVRFVTDWEDYNGTFKIDPNNRYVVYAKVTDNAGNTMYINSDGITLDDIAPTLEGIENGKTYYGDLTVIKSDEQFYDIKVVTLDGEPMGFNEGTYGLIPADNAEHIVVVEDHAGNKTTYTVTVYKNYTVTFKADGNIVDTQAVGYGKDATAPAIPAKEGYTQTAPTWDKDGKNITTDTEINAVYTINKYTVTYKADGEVVDTVTVEHGKDATAPAIPAKEGYTQTAPAWDKDGKNITADTEINAVYTKNDPGEYEVFAPETNVGGSKLTGSTEEVKKEVPFTEEELWEVEHGADVDIWLEVKDISEKISKEDKSLIEQKLDDHAIGLYLDVTMFKQVGDNPAVKLTKLNDHITITLRVPDNLINSDSNVMRTYQIIHVHNGAAEIIGADFDSATKMLTFETARFSTYALAYKDTETSGSAPADPQPSEPTTPETSEPTSPETPQSGDDSNLWLWVVLLFVSGGCLFGIALNERRRRRTNK